MDRLQSMAAICRRRRRRRRPASTVDRGSAVTASDDVVLASQIT